MHEIMIMREGRLRLFQVDDNTLAKLTKIRGSLFADDTRLRPMSELPTMIPETQPKVEYSQAALESTERAVKLRQLMTDAKITTSPHVIEPEQKPMTFDEQLEHDWRHSPALRKEFASQASYTAYMRAVRDGRAKVYGRG